MIMKKTNILIRSEVHKQFSNRAFWFSALGIPLLMSITFFTVHTFFSFRESSQISMISNMSLYDKRIIFAILLWFIVSFGLLLNIIRASQNLFEEKNSKILEVLFTCVKPIEFLTARVFSSLITGSIQYLSGILLIVIILIVTGIGKELLVFTPEELICWIIVFFTFFELGMLFYTSLSFLSIVVFKNIHNIQSGQMIMSLIVISPTFFIFNIVRNPNSALVDTLMYNPFSGAFIYPVKVVLTQFQIWEFLTVAFIIFGSSLLVLNLVSRIIRQVILIR